MHWWLEPVSPLTWLCSCMDCILYLMCICCSKWLLFSCLETRRLYFVTAFFFPFFSPFLLYCTWGNCKCFSMAFKQEENKLFYIKHYAGDAYIFPFTTLVLVLFGWYDELKFQDVWIFFCIVGSETWHVGGTPTWVNCYELTIDWTILWAEETWLVS